MYHVVASQSIVYHYACKKKYENNFYMELGHDIGIAPARK